MKNDTSQRTKKEEKAENKLKNALSAPQKAIVQAIDVNGNGEIDIEDIIALGMRVPGIRVNREDFLRREFMKNHPENVVDKVVQLNPAQAKINPREVDKLADEVIKFERNCVSGISAALGMPGGIAMVGTIPADLAQYYGYLLRATQKLMYLYGFQQIDTGNEKAMMDSETMNILILCMGVMSGVQGANTALKTMANALGRGVEQRLLRFSLTKGTIYPIVKSVSKWFGVRMSKQIYAGFFRKAIPVVGGALGGGITFFTFKPCCDRLKDALKDTYLSNPLYHETEEEKELNKKIEVEYKEID